MKNISTIINTRFVCLFVCLFACLFVCWVVRSFICLFFQTSVFLMNLPKRTKLKFEKKIIYDTLATNRACTFLQVINMINQSRVCKGPISIDSMAMLSTKHSKTNHFKINRLLFRGTLTRFLFNFTRSLFKNCKLNEGSKVKQKRI